MTDSRVLRKLRSGEIVRTIAVSRVDGPWFAESIGNFGFDLIWFDMEHRAFPYSVLDPLSLACRAKGIDLMVRILKDGYMAPMRALEMGANGIMVPHCRSVAEARQWVEWTRFPPLGKRGFDGAGADADFGRADPLAYLDHVAREVFLVLQIEDREAVDVVDEIAAVDGVDLLFIGGGDLSLSYGVPLQTGHLHVQRAIDAVAAACAKRGKWWGMPAAGPEAAQALVNRGARLVVCGGDHGFLMNGLEASAHDYASLKVHD